ncbi:hypothetical protein D3C87_1740140 [compost metagenome]
MADWTWTDEEIAAQYEAARKATEEALRTEIRALSARYDRASRRVIIELSSGAALMVPVDRIQALEGSADEDLAMVEVSPLGDGIAWPRLDWHHGLNALLAGRFGSKAWMERQRATREKEPRAAEG